MSIHAIKDDSIRAMQQMEYMTITHKHYTPSQINALNSYYSLYDLYSVIKPIAWYHFKSKRYTGYKNK